MKTLIDLIDAQQMAKENPDTFYAPSRQKLDAINPGDFVKICVGGERFWVEVSAISIYGERITGRIDNELVRSDVHGLSFDDIISFEKKNVYDIVPPVQKDVDPSLN